MGERVEETDLEGGREGCFVGSWGDRTGGWWMERVGCCFLDLKPMAETKELKEMADFTEEREGEGSLEGSLGEGWRGRGHQGRDGESVSGRTEDMGEEKEKERWVLVQTDRQVTKESGLRDLRLRDRDGEWSLSPTQGITQIKTLSHQCHHVTSLPL
ncbi:hypothetical protein BDQ17DRAFT_1320445 [Cyathus striatus]|nr:hypothetical protein BDQ17DRAFT_1320445 [Cyathus striatus]